MTEPRTTDARRQEIDALLARVNESQLQARRLSERQRQTALEMREETRELLGRSRRLVLGG